MSRKYEPFKPDAHEARSLSCYWLDRWLPTNDTTSYRIEFYTYKLHLNEYLNVRAGPSPSLSGHETVATLAVAERQSSDLKFHLICYSSLSARWRQPLNMFTVLFTIWPLFNASNYISLFYFVIITKYEMVKKKNVTSVAHVHNVCDDAIHSY